MSNSFSLKKLCFNILIIFLIPFFILFYFIFLLFWLFFTITLIGPLYNLIKNKNEKILLNKNNLNKKLNDLKFITIPNNIHSASSKLNYSFLLLIFLFIFSVKLSLTYFHSLIFTLFHSFFPIHSFSFFPTHSLFQTFFHSNSHFNSLKLSFISLSCFH